jgi:hypothetical protein
MTDPRLLIALFIRFGVTISTAEAGSVAEHPPREALVFMLANREISARFDAAHGRPPHDDDVEALLDLYLALKAREVG